MALHLNSDHLYQIQTHAESTYPHECCGLLLGKLAPEGADARSLIEVWQTQNAWSDDVARELSEIIQSEVVQSEIIQSQPVKHNSSRSKSDRYWIDPKEMLAGQRYARDRHLTMIGIYHSHPDHPAVPSECDRILAWFDYSYLIVSVHQGSAQNLLSWRLDPNHQFQPELILNDL